MRLRHLLCCALLAGSLVGCWGPKDDCEGTMRSFESIVDGNHWDSFPDIVHPPLRKKYGDLNLTRWVGGYYEGARSFKFTSLQASVAGNICLCQTTSTWTQKIRGHEAETFADEYNAYTLHLIDGKWYMELPGSAKVQAF
ncbi:MAG: hypothetical protein JST54_15065 [Deltaproteobacteria bacterium]|nr:hypothetical protein [Deltaproteobacteria bacterium]